MVISARGKSEAGECRVRTAIVDGMIKKGLIEVKCKVRGQTTGMPGGRALQAEGSGLQKGLEGQLVGFVRTEQQGPA